MNFSDFHSVSIDHSKSLIYSHLINFLHFWQYCFQLIHRWFLNFKFHDAFKNLRSPFIWIRDLQKMGRKWCVQGRQHLRGNSFHHLHASSECNRATACGTCRDVGFGRHSHPLASNEGGWGALASGNRSRSDCHRKRGPESNPKWGRHSGSEGNFGEGGSAPKNCCLCWEFTGDNQEPSQGDGVQLRLVSGTLHHGSAA